MKARKSALPGCALIALLGLVLGGLAIAFSAALVLGAGNLPLGTAPTPDAAGALALVTQVQTARAGVPFTVTVSEGTATLAARTALAAARVSEVNGADIRFSEGGRLVATAEVGALGGRRLALVYDLTVDGTTLRPTLVGGALKLFGPADGALGWVLVPAGAITSQPLYAQAQRMIDAVAATFNLRSLHAGKGVLRLVLIKRT